MIRINRGLCFVSSGPSAMPGPGFDTSGFRE